MRLGTFLFLFLAAVLAVTFSPAEALAQTAHQGKTLWGQVAQADAGYNVYHCQGNAAACTALTQFTKLTATPLPPGTGSYIDLMVTANTTYTWAVTAICPAAGCATGETGEGNPALVTATIPKNTGTPGVPPNVTEQTQ